MEREVFLAKRARMRATKPADKWQAPKPKNARHMNIRYRRYKVEYLKNGDIVGTCENLTRKVAEETKAQALRTSKAYGFNTIETKTKGWNWKEIHPKDFGPIEYEGHPATTSTMTEAIQKRNERKNRNKVLNQRRSVKVIENRYSLPISDKRHPYHEMYLEQVRTNGFKVIRKSSGYVEFEGLKNAVLDYLVEHYSEYPDDVEVQYNGEDK